MIMEESETEIPEATPASRVDEERKPRVRRLADVLGAKCRIAFEKAAVTLGGEVILWDVYPVPAPHPMQPGSIVTGVGLYISIPSAIVGQSLTITSVFDPGLVDANQDAVDTFILDRVNELIGARRQQAMDAATQAAAERNGHVDPPESPAGPGGLIVPGR